MYNSGKEDGNYCIGLYRDYSESLKCMWNNGLFGGFWASILPALGVQVLLDTVGPVGASLTFGPLTMWCPDRPLNPKPPKP